MKIKLSREGGFIGLAANKSVDFADLSAEEKELFNNTIEEKISQQKEEATAEKSDKNAVKTAKKVSLDSTGTRGLDAAIPADVQSYEIKVRKGSKTITIKFDDTNIPEKMYMMFQKYV